MAFVNPLDKYRLSSSPPQQPRPPSTTRSARPAAYPQSLSPASWEYHKAATTTPVQRQQRQRRPRQTSQSVSPSRRRVTRSQSRQLEASRGDDAERLAGAARRGKAKAKQNTDLAAVIEEPPSASQSHARDTIPESPEEHNISGTTILPAESEPDTGDLDPLMMIEALPDLQRAASAVLEFFAPNLTSPGSIIDLAKRLQDPKSTQSRRLERLRSNFSTETKYFGNQTYIEVEQVARALPSVEIPPAPGSSQARSWQADGILFKSNCARLALEVLTRPSFSASVESAIYDLEGKFPSPFLNALVRESEINTAGKSSLRRATFDLALDIRTQFLKVNLETHKNDDNFSPNAILNHSFFNEILETQEDVDQPPLRGFNLSMFQDEDGNLPSRYEDDVLDRVSDIRKFFRDDEVDFEGLEATFPWEGFLYSVGKWIRMRDEEVNRQLSRQPAADDMRDQLEEAVNRRSSLDQEAAREKAKAVETTAVDSTAADSTSVRPTVEAPAMEPVNQPRRELLPAAEIRERRASSRSSFLNAAAIRHLFEREERSKSAQRTPEPRTRRSDFAGFISRHAAGEPSASAAGWTRPASEAPRVEAREREIPASPEADVFADPDKTIVADSQWEDADGNARADRGEARRPDLTVPERREVEAPLPGPSSAEVLAVIQRHKEATKAKPRHLFIDRQENATRVSPISENSLVPETVNRKRKRVEVPEEESDEEAFTQDERRVDIVLKRAQKPQQKKPRLEDTQTDDEEPGEQLRSELASSAAPTPHREHAYMAGGAARVSSPTPAAAAPAAAAPAPVLQAPRPSAVSNVAMPQSRRRWSLEENERLIYLVGKYGTSWAEIKRRDELWPENRGGPRLTDRDQTQLKDRARNIVIEYYSCAAAAAAVAAA
ncbi:MYB DNA-binding domain protein [Rasamsonia emersonii CBS 393.64]|uniref:MYB DNA-binding domain protein n=1 Tax=Rasamsonia emersonii (strain ATCC 16479 / CBS 393.64 / IMI 116815) TaxID=1408163 RepID=A0A0F4Z4N5_RASE3|nr:MYB DNA-binding domain protein [Rasamsonia emersonii CBS 393.64]KKA24833.1 MYB DNA-binding domain protein [Rasamsonia emersonii CBS 393.64]